MDAFEKTRKVLFAIFRLFHTVRLVYFFAFCMKKIMKNDKIAKNKRVSRKATVSVTF